MGIQINGITDTISATDGGLAVSGQQLTGVTDINASGIVTATQGYVVGTGASVFSPAANTLALGTNGSERIRVDSSGRLGLGTSSPSANLHVAGTAIRVDGSTTATVNLNGSAYGMVSAGADLYLETAGSGNQVIFRRGGTESARFDASGRLGVGTSPAYAFHVSQSPNTTGIFLSASSTSTAGDYSQIAFGSSGGGSAVHAAIRSAYNNPQLGGATSLQFFTNNNSSTNEAARLDSSGRLLVGTSTSRSTWKGDGVNNFVQIEYGGGGYGPGLTLYGNSSTTTRSPILTLGKSGGTTVGSFTLAPANEPIGRIHFEGADGTQSVAAATIEAYVDGTPSANDMPGRLVFATTADGASSPTERMRLTSAGQLRIGSRIDLNPDQDASGSGNERSVGFFNGTGGSIIASNAFNQTGTITHIKFYNGNGAVGSVTTNGSATAYNTSSDYRLKENVVAVTDGITRLQKLKPSRFNFIADPDTALDGFIAHEVQAVVPEAVTGSKDEVDADSKPVYQGIDQSKLVPLLTAALQEAIGEIESLKARVVALETA